MMSMRANGLLRKKWHAPVARSRVILPWHAPVARSRGTLPWHAPPARVRGERFAKPEILVENTFTNGLQ